MSGRRPLACSCSVVSPPLLQCTNPLFIFTITIQTLVEKQPPCVCVLPRLRLHRLRAERGQQELFTLGTWCYLLHPSQRMFNVNFKMESLHLWRWCWTLTSVLCFCLPVTSWFYPASSTSQLMKWWVFKHVPPSSLLVLSKTAVLARPHRSTSPSCLVISDQCGHPLAAPSPLCLYSCLLGRSPTPLHRWRS